MTKNHRLFSVKDISQLTALPLRSCYRLKLPWLKLNGRTKRVLESDFNAYLHRIKQPCR